MAKFIIDEEYYDQILNELEARRETLPASQDAEQDKETTMKEKLKSLLPQLAVALAGGILPLLMALTWQQYQSGRMFGAATFSILYVLCIFLLLWDGFYRLFEGSFKKSLLWAGAVTLVLTALSFSAYLLVAHLLVAGTLIRMLVFFCTVLVFSVLAYGFALFMALRSIPWIDRAIVSGVALVAVLALVSFSMST